MNRSLFAKLIGLFEMLRGAAEGYGADTQLEGKSLAGQAGVVITVVVIGVISLVGILIFAQVEQAIPGLNDSPLSGSVTSITEGFGSAIEFVPIIMLVLLASVVIMVVQRMRG